MNKPLLLLVMAALLGYLVGRYHPDRDKVVAIHEAEQITKKSSV